PFWGGTNWKSVEGRGRIGNLSYGTPAGRCPAAVATRWRGGPGPRYDVRPPVELSRQPIQGADGPAAVPRHPADHGVRGLVRRRFVRRTGLVAVPVCGAGPRRRLHRPALVGGLSPRPGGDDAGAAVVSRRAVRVTRRPYRRALHDGRVPGVAIRVPARGQLPGHLVYVEKRHTEAVWRRHAARRDRPPARLDAGRPPRTRQGERGPGRASSRAAPRRHRPAVWLR